jgi:signal transduction histidine kinase
LGEINESIERMEDVINVMLLAAEIEGGGKIYDDQEVNVRNECKEIIERLESRFSGKAVSISASFSGALSGVALSGRLFFVIFKELLANAIKYTPNKGKIICSVRRNGNRIIFRVADTGYGIPISQHNKVFTKFFRADNIQDKNGAGSGMGLYVVKRSVDILGGTIAFESKENEGTVFTVTIPIKK